MSVNVSFELLYGDDKITALSVFLQWADKLTGSLGVGKISIDDDQALKFVSNLRREEYPAVGGFDESSPFKKAAGIYVWLQAVNPFLPAGKIGDLPVMDHSMAAIVGFGIVRQCLNGATFVNRDKQTVTLKNPINVSDHFYKDFIEASRGITPESHFKTYSLLFEALAYEANENASYPKMW